MRSKRTVAITETSSEPTHPSRLEKKTNNVDPLTGKWIVGQAVFLLVHARRTKASEDAERRAERLHHG
jgi:hypothetical protein